MRRQAQNHETVERKKKECGGALLFLCLAGDSDDDRGVAAGSACWVGGENSDSGSCFASGCFVSMDQISAALSFFFLILPVKRNVAAFQPPVTVTSAL